MADRTCDRCGTRMSPYLPRKKSDNGEYLCRGCQQIEGYAARKLLEWSRMGSTGQDCRFIEEQPGEWYYELEGWDGEYTQYGPFKSLEEGERHLRDNHANPGGWSVHYYDEKLGSRKVAHDSGDGERVFHCFAGDTRYLTRDGIKTLAETVGTVQQVLTADQNSREGRWVDAMIHSFGEQPLMEVRLRRNQQVKVVYATPEHQWIYRSGGRKSRYGRKPTRELKAGDRLAAALPPRVEGLSLSPEGVRHGIVYGDGTASNGYSSVHLWGEKDKQLLPWFEMTGEASVSPTMTANGVAGVRVSAKMPASYKAVPDTDDLDYLYGWLAGYFAADGNVTKQGNVKLDSADYGSLEAVREIALRLGIATYGIVSKMRQGYGDEPTLLHSVEFIGSTLTEDFFLIESHRDRFRFRDYRYERIGWVVDSVTETDRVEEVFCPRVPGTESFVLEDWLHTAQCPFCGAGQQVGRSDGTIECGFCDAHYTVQVQPNHSAAPQTIDGVPHTPPEMPGEGPGKAPEEEDPFERATELELEPGEEDDGPLENDNPFTEQSDDDDDKPPFLSSRQYRVGKHVLSEDDYLRHIALKFAGSGRDRVLEAVRQSRGR